MPARNRLKGKSVSFTIEGNEYNLDASVVEVVSEEADDDFIPFADATGGSYDYFLNITAAQSTDAEALHTFLRENKGETVDFVFAPHGNVVPSAAQPHVSGTVTLPNRLPNIGGEVNTTWTFEEELKLDGEPVYITAAGA